MIDIYEHHAMLYGCPLVVMTCSSISFSASSLLLALVGMLVPHVYLVMLVL
jgi:hypothetical protein